MMRCLRAYINKLKIWETSMFLFSTSYKYIKKFDLLLCVLNHMQCQNWKIPSNGLVQHFPKCIPHNTNSKRQTVLAPLEKGQGQGFNHLTSILVKNLGNSSYCIPSWKIIMYINILKAQRSLIVNCFSLLQSTEHFPNFLIQELCVWDTCMSNVNPQGKFWKTVICSTVFIYIINQKSELALAYMQWNECLCHPV